MISLEPLLSANGKRVYTIVFSSNALNPANSDGTDPNGTLAADGNQEIWTYELPAVADADLASGADLPLVDLSAGTFTRITNTPASRVPSAGGTNAFPFVADDNREATISDNGKVIAFVSTRTAPALPGASNADGNPEIFLYNLTSKTFTQLTNTQDVINNGRLLFTVFNENPSISSGGSVVAFISNGNLTGDNNDDGKGNGNAESLSVWSPLERMMHRLPFCGMILKKPNLLSRNRGSPSLCASSRNLFHLASIRLWKPKCLPGKKRLVVLREIWPWD